MPVRDICEFNTSLNHFLKEKTALVVPAARGEWTNKDLSKVLLRCSVTVKVEGPFRRFFF